MAFAGGVALVSGACYLLARAVLFCSARWLRFLMMRHAMRAVCVLGGVAAFACAVALASPHP
eukprot:3290527-Prymnesium_polylepis.1